MKTKEFVITSVFIFVLLVLFKFFPTQDYFQQIIANVSFFVVIPVLFIKLILKKPLSCFGIKWGDFRSGILLAVGSLLSTGFIFFLISKYLKILPGYKIPKIITNDFGEFIFYELTIVLLIVLLYEFFFRGFIMHSLSFKIGAWSILAQCIVFLILLYFSKISLVSFLPYIIFAPFSGVIAYKSGSILYSIVAQLVMVVIVDATVVALLR